MADKYWVDLAEEEQVSPRDAIVGFTPPCRAGLPSRAIALCFFPNIYQLVAESGYTVPAHQYPVRSMSYVDIARLPWSALSRH
jgi:hypothetical protein